jgi:hypothetical protein
MYTFFLDDICNKYSNNKDKVINTITNFYTKNNNLIRDDVFEKISSCTDSFVCKTDSIEREKNTKITDWKCIKKEVDIFEYHYYINKLNYFKF